MTRIVLSSVSVKQE